MLRDVIAEAISSSWRDVMPDSDFAAWARQGKVQSCRGAPIHSSNTGHASGSHSLCFGDENEFGTGFEFEKTKYPLHAVVDDLVRAAEVRGSIMIARPNSR